jgi:hypothetical protein
MNEHLLPYDFERLEERLALIAMRLEDLQRTILVSAMLNGIGQQSQTATPEQCGAAVRRYVPVLLKAIKEMKEDEL